MQIQRRPLIVLIREYKRFVCVCVCVCVNDCNFTAGRAINMPSVSPPKRQTSCLNKRSVPRSVRDVKKKKRRRGLFYSSVAGDEGETFTFSWDGRGRPLNNASFLKTSRNNRFGSPLSPDLRSHPVCHLIGRLMTVAGRNVLCK